MFDEPLTSDGITTNYAFNAAGIVGEVGATENTSLTSTPLLNQTITIGNYSNSAVPNLSYSSSYYEADISVKPGLRTSTIWVSATDPPGALELLENFQVRDASDVMNYLIREPSLILLLNQSIARVRAVFGESTRLGLELSKIPGVADSTLFCFVETSLPPPDAVKALETFDQQWWINQVPLVAGRLNFDVTIINEPL